MSSHDVGSALSDSQIFSYSLPGFSLIRSEKSYPLQGSPPSLKIPGG